jgi:hypothetical protein
MEREVLGNIAVLGESLPLHYFVHYKSYMIDLESNQKNYVSSEALGMVALGTHWIGGWVRPRASLDDMK